MYKRYEVEVVFQVRARDEDSAFACTHDMLGDLSQMHALPLQKQLGVFGFELLEGCVTEVADDA